MKQNLNNEQCELLLKKHGIRVEEENKRAIYALLREAYRIGMNADVMKTVMKDIKK